MKYSYQARTKSGELQVGSVEAASREAALNILTGNDLYILSLEVLKKRISRNVFYSFFGELKKTI